MYVNLIALATSTIDTGEFSAIIRGYAQRAALASCCECLALLPILLSQANIVLSQLNSAIGGDPDGIFLVVSDIGTPSGEGFDFVDGFAFLERYYLLFDSENSQFGFAETPFTFATTN